jgi:hypothetical protein
MAAEMYSEAARKILFDPISLGADRLCILSEQASPNMASWLLKAYDENKITGISIELIITSVPEQGVPLLDHEGFIALHKSFRKDKPNLFSCSYVYGTFAVKKNLYIWLCGEKPVKAFSSSYNFVQNSLLKGRSGSISDRSASAAYKTFEKAVSSSIYCVSSEVDDYVVIGPSRLPAAADLTADDPNYITLSLVVKKTGEPGKKSGLNWGQRKKRNPNEAYIPLPRKIAKSGFFPLGKQHFLVVTDDHHTLQLRVEQQNDKAITTPASNAQLGEYFRNRLGLAYGAYVHSSDLDAYGRRDVSFYKIDDEQYYMDFSVNKGKK